MQWLRNRWYQIAWSEDVNPGRPLVRTILEEPILLFRTEAGKLTALLDRCPHRFAPLSAGTIDGEIVTCGYHGLAFGTGGACVHNPHGAITSSMKVKSFPIEERHKAIWIWMGDGEQADPALVPDLSFIDETPETARLTGYVPTRANYQLLTDNIMDLSHADFLHPTSLGGIMTGAKARSWEDGDRIVAEWVSQNCEPPPAFRPALPPGAAADIWIEVIWSAPALMVLGTAATATGVGRTPHDEARTLHNMVPETATSTHYFFCATRRFLLESVEFNNYLRGAFAQAFEMEDKPMLEKQQIRMGTANLWDLDPILLPVDAAAVRVRRKLDKLLEAESASSSAS